MDFSEINIPSWILITIIVICTFIIFYNILGNRILKKIFKTISKYIVPVFTLILTIAFLFEGRSLNSESNIWFNGSNIKILIIVNLILSILSFSLFFLLNGTEFKNIKKIIFFLINFVSSLTLLLFNYYLNIQYLKNQKKEDENKEDENSNKSFKKYKKSNLITSRLLLIILIIVYIVSFTFLNKYEKFLKKDNEFKFIAVNKDSENLNFKKENNIKKIIFYLTCLTSNIIVFFYGPLGIKNSISDSLKNVNIKIYPLTLLIPIILVTIIFHLNSEIKNFIKNTFISRLSPFISLIIPFLFISPTISQTNNATNKLFFSIIAGILLFICFFTASFYSNISLWVTFLLAIALIIGIFCSFFYFSDTIFSTIINKPWVLVIILILILLITTSVASLGLGGNKNKLMKNIGLFLFILALIFFSYNWYLFPKTGWITFLGFIFFLILSYFLSKIFKNKSESYQGISGSKYFSKTNLYFTYLLIIPCLLSDFWGKFTTDASDTPPIVWYLLGTITLILVLYFIIFKKLKNPSYLPLGGYIITKDCINLNKEHIFDKAKIQQNLSQLLNLESKNIVNKSTYKFCTAEDSDSEINNPNEGNVCNQTTDCNSESAPDELICKPTNINNKNIIYNSAISFWCYIDPKNTTITTNYQANILNFLECPKISYSPGDNNYSFHFNLVGDTTKEISTKDEINIPLQKWNHFLIQLFEGRIDIFINQNLFYSRPLIVSIPENFIKIGQSQGIDGKLCYLSYFDRTLTLSEIQTLYNRKPEKY